MWRELRLLQHRSREQLSSIRAETLVALASEKVRLREFAAQQSVRHFEFKRRVEQETSAEVFAAVVRTRSDILFSITGFFFAGTAALFGYLRYVVV